jgi:hypothetical protein
MVDMGVAASCTSVVPAGSCGGASFTFPKDECDGAGDIMKPEIAALFVECLSILTGEELCDATPVYTCKQLALLESCPDPDVEDDCATLVDECASTANPIDPQECSDYLSGMTETARTEMVDCGVVCSSDGLYTCSEGL